MKGGCLRANGLLHPYRRTTFCSIVSIRAWTPWDSVGSLSPCCAGRIPRCTRSAARTPKSLPISRGTGWACTCRTTWTHRSHVSRRHPQYFGRISRRCNPFRRRAIETNETRADLARRAKQRKHGAGGDTSTHGRQLGKLRPIVNRSTVALAPDSGGSQPPLRLPACPHDASYSTFMSRTLAMLNSPASVPTTLKPATFKTSVPGFDRVEVSAPLVTPIFWLPNERVVGFSDPIGVP